MSANANKFQQFTVKSTTGYHIEVSAQYAHGNHWVIKLECPETGESDYARYVAEYGRGLEEVGPGPTPEDIATISNLLGEMVRDFCTDRMLVVDDEYQRDYRIATVEEAMESLSARDGGQIVVDDNVVCFVQF